MIKLAIHFIVLIFILSGSNSNKIDGLISDQEISLNEINQSITTDSLFNLSRKYVGIDNGIARLYAQKGLELINELNEKDDYVKYYILNGQICYYEDNYEQSLIFLDSAKNYLSENSPDLIADFYFQYSQTNACIGNYPAALESCQTSKNYYEQSENNHGIVKCKTYIGAIYMNQGDLIKADKFFKSALKNLNNKNNQLLYANILMNLSKLKLQQDSLLVGLNYANEAHQIFLGIGDLRRIASISNIKTKIEIKLNRNENAVSELRKIILIYLQLEEKYGLTSAYHNMSIAFFNLQKNDSALKYSLLANNLANNIQSQPQIAETSLQLSKIFKTIGEYKKALEKFEDYEKINSELISIESSKQISNIEYKTQLQSKDKDIKILTQNNQIRKKNNLIIISVSVASALLLILIIIALRMKNTSLKNQSELLENKNRIIENENKIHEQKKIILENNLEIRNKELASKALALLQLNESLKEIGTSLNGSNNGKDKISLEISKKIMANIQVASHSNIWKEFDTAFNNVHNSFYEKLFEICPNLSAAEIKIAALLKLNLSTKEIAAITFKSESAIKTTRHRLRQKLSIPQDKSLISFILKL